MTRNCAVFVRNNRAPAMAPLRAALSGLGLADVDSFGSSGNFVLNAPNLDAAELERLATDALQAQVLVRSRQELAAIVANDPFFGQQGACLFLARQAVDQSSSVFSDAPGPQGQLPVALGSTVYFVHPTRREGRKTIVNFEHELGVVGTMRTSRVAARVLDLMTR